MAIPTSTNLWEGPLMAIPMARVSCHRGLRSYSSARLIINTSVLAHLVARAGPRTHSRGLPPTRREPSTPW